MNQHPSSLPRLPRTVLALVAAILLLAVGACKMAPAVPEPAEPPQPLPTLWEAAATGDIDSLEAHRQAGANMNSLEPEAGVTPLTVAAGSDELEAVRWLLANGADVDARGGDGGSSLLAAAFLGRTDAVRILLEAGADAGARNDDGMTAWDLVGLDWQTTSYILDMLEMDLPREQLEAGRQEILVLLHPALVAASADNIEKATLSLAVTPFVRAPQTEDPVRSNDAYARIQYLLPVPGSARLAFNDIRGILYLTNADGAAPSVYLDLRAEDVGFDNSRYPTEAGFMGFAFHPQFATPDTHGYGKFYTAFSASPESGVADYGEDAPSVQESVVREWTADDPNAEVFAGTSREVMRVGQFAPNHNVGTIAFNPNAAEGEDDYGLLYICYGDGGGANDRNDNGQNLATPLGAIARIDPLGGADGARYGIPASNPFVDTEGAAGEIWAYGLRHPQQFSWDADGRMFIGDIGQYQLEEVNLGVAGANYGWRLREGTFATGYEYGARRGPVYPLPEQDRPDFVYPVAQYDHDEGFAVGGGYVYRGAGIPALYGRYVFTDFPRGRVFAIDVEDLTPGDPATIVEVRLFFDGEERDLVDVAGFPNPSKPRFPRVDARIGIDHAGELYLLTKGDGWIRKLSAHGR